ncbi:hypothetical protein [Demequina maris]|uniref:hypothetical protein n=1 Tax=Demequina maris TaxID=1638982 RepID=UPI0007802657|nr:hypothetical protein [Demequina maris]
MAEFIRQYTPQVPPEEWAAYGQFTKAIMTDLHVGTVRKAKNDNTALVRFVRWCWRDCGLPLEREVLFTTEMIDNFIAVGCDNVMDSTRAAWRSRLRRCAALMGMPDFSAMPPEAITAEHNASAPYTPAETDVLRVWARHQRSSYRKVNANLVLALGLGAGLSTSEMLAVTGRDVTVDDDGVVVDVNGKGSRARSVPLLQQWEDPVATMVRAAMRPDDYLLFPRRRVAANPNLISMFVTTVGAPSVPVKPNRMRATWIVGHLSRVPGDILTTAAGLESLDGLGRFAKWVPEPDRAQVRRMLRAKSADETAGGDAA